MARIQILELPAVCHRNGDDETPFVVIIDQADDAFRHAIARTDEAMYEAQKDLAEAIGARSILVFPGTVEIPANDTSAYVTGTAGDVRLDFQADAPKFGPPVGGEILTDSDRIPGRYA